MRRVMTTSTDVVVSIFPSPKPPEMIWPEICDRRDLSQAWLSDFNSSPPYRMIAARASRRTRTSPLEIRPAAVEAVFRDRLAMSTSQMIPAVSAVHSLAALPVTAHAQTNRRRVGEKCRVEHTEFAWRTSRRGLRQIKPERGCPALAAQPRVTFTSCRRLSHGLILALVPLVRPGSRD